MKAEDLSVASSAGYTFTASQPSHYHPGLAYLCRLRLLLFSPSVLSVPFCCLLFLLFLFFFAFVSVLTVCACGDPEATLAVLASHVGVLPAKVNTLALSALLATLRKITSAGAELGGDCGIGGDPVCKGVFAILDNT